MLENNLLIEPTGTPQLSNQNFVVDVLLFVFAFFYFVLW